MHFPLRHTRPLIRTFSAYVDVHTHIFHEAFQNKQNEIVDRAVKAGLKHVIVNGVDSETNRRVLDLCSKYPNILIPALGIYPIDACAHELAADNSLFCNHSIDYPPPKPFDVENEIKFIEQQAEKHNIIAVGECGLDAHYVASGSTAFKKQEQVFEQFIEIALKHDIPLIIHSRKAESRVFDMLKYHKVLKADFHCFGGKMKLAQQIAEEGYYMSIPSAVSRISNFQILAKRLPLDRILTETDAPFMGPTKAQLNEPSTIPIAVKAIAESRGESIDMITEAISQNFINLFGNPKKPYSYTPLDSEVNR